MTVTTKTSTAVRTTVDTKAFVRELEWVARFINARSSIPVLSSVWLQGSAAGLLCLTATDLETGAQTCVESYSYTAAGFSICFDAKQALKYLKKITDARIVLEQNGTDLSIEVDDGSCVLNGSGPESFPVLPSLPGRYTIGGLNEAIPRVVMAISKEESRFTLNGALFDGSRMVAIDGYRLSLAAIQSDLPGRALVPSFALNELRRLGVDSVAVGIDENHVAFHTGDRTIIARKLTGNFPNYERVIPKDLPYRATIDADALKRHGERVAVFACERSHALMFTLADNKLTIRAHQNERGGAAASVATTWEQPEWRSGFNWNYILDFLKLIPATAFDLRFGDMAKRDNSQPQNEAAVIFESADWQYVVMPMRI